MKGDRRTAPLAEWPQGTPLDFDPVIFALDQSRAAFLVTITVSFGLAGFSLTPLGRSWFGVLPVPLVSFTLLHALEFARGVFWDGARVQVPTAWVRRAEMNLVTTAVASTYGACAVSEASPGYAVVLAAALVFGENIPGNWLTAAMLVAVPLLERAVFVPGASVGSLAVALGMGALAALMYFRSSLRSIRLLQLRRQVTSSAELTRSAHQQEARLRVAMSLHDGLSGALYAARLRANSASLSTVIDAGRTSLLRADEVLRVGHTRTGNASADLAASLNGMLAALGVDGVADVIVTGTRAIPDDEVDDIRDIGMESIANAAKHGGSALKMRVALGPAEVRIDCRTDNAGTAELGCGRGLGNAELRAKSRAGGASWKLVNGVFSSSTWWPAGLTRRSDRNAGLALDVGAGLALPLGCVLLNSSAGALVAPGIAFAYGLALHLWGGKRLETARRELAAATAARRDAGRTPVRRTVSALLAPQLKALEGAVTAQNPAEIRATLDDLRTGVGDLLWALESCGAPVASASDALPSAPVLEELLRLRQAERTSSHATQRTALTASS